MKEKKMNAEDNTHNNLNKLTIKSLNSEEENRTSSESASRLIYIADENNNLTYVNKAMCSALGYKKQELLRMELHQIFNKESFGNIKMREQTELLEEEEINERVHFITKDGKEILGDLIITPIFNSEKELIGSRAIFQDLSERRKYGRILQESRERYQTLVENLPVGIAIISEDGRIVSANNIALEIFGYELQDLNWLTTSHLYSNPEDKAILLQKISNKELVWNHEIQLKRKDGSKIQIMANVKPISYSNGNYYLVAFNDITNKEKNYNDLKSNKKNSEDCGKSDYELLAEMASKIRTPIIIILNLNAAVRYEVEYDVDSETRSFFEEIETASKRILRIVDLVLEMSTLESGKYEIKRKRIDINKDILNKLYNKFKPFADEKDIVLKLIIDTKDTTITADEFSTIQIFSYLIENAIKYIDRGEIQIIIKKVNNNKLHITITDTGIGMSKEYTPNLFKMFSQEKQDFTGRNNGAGLALALVKKYCDINGAGIHIESEKRKGSRFTISFNLNVD